MCSQSTCSMMTQIGLQFLKIKCHSRPHTSASVIQWRPPTSKPRHTSLPDTLLSSCLLTSFIKPPLSCFFFLPSSPGTFPPSLSVCVPSIVTIFSLRLTRLPLSGDWCVRVDRDALYLSNLVLRENRCVMLTGMTDGDAWKSSTWGGKKAVLPGEERKPVESIDDALAFTL